MSSTAYYMKKHQRKGVKTLPIAELQPESPQSTKGSKQLLLYVMSAFLWIENARIVALGIMSLFRW